MTMGGNAYGTGGTRCITFIVLLEGALMKLGYLHQQWILSRSHSNCL